MPRRMITSEIWYNEKVTSLPDTGRLLFIGIFSSADNEGRLRASPKYLRAHIFPYDYDKTDKLIKQLRDQCAELRLIRLYSKDGREYLDIPGWYEHQSIRKDRYKQSDLPAFEDGNDITPTTIQPLSTQPPTADGTNKGEGRGTKENTPLSIDKGARKQRADPIINEIFTEMRSYLGYPDKTDKDPIPNYAKEGQFLKKMLSRHFTREEILSCWKVKVQRRRGEFVSLTWVNEDIADFVRGGEALPYITNQAKRRRRPGQVPTEEELEEQKRERRLR